MFFTAERFKALSSRTRLSIMRALKSRRMTLSEISTVLGMHVSTVSEHLEMLQKTGLVSRKDEGYKWKYYYLTKDGETLFFNKETGIIIPVGIAFIIGGIWDIFGRVRAPQAAQDTLMQSGILEKAAENISGAPPAIPVSPAYANGLILIGVGVIIVLFVLYRKCRKK